MFPKIVGRVVVGVDGSPGSLEALRFAVGQSRLLEATLVPALAWSPPGGELAARRAPSPHYTGIMREFAEKDLLKAFEEGLGGLPADIRVEPRLIQGAAGPVLVEAANHRNDLLVIGAGRRGRLRHPISAVTARYCLAHALCPVIAVPPPPLQAELPAQLRRRVEINHLLDDLTHTHTG